MFFGSSLNTLSKSCLHLILLPAFMQLCIRISAATTDKCYLNVKTNEEEEKLLLKRLNPLFGQEYNIEKNGFTYTLAICVDVPKSPPNVSVTRSKDDNILPLGRRNETQISGGDTWVMLRYNCDKCSNSKENQCLGNRSTSIYIVCDPLSHEESGLQLTEEDDCHFKFVLPTTMICEHEKEVSGTTVFLILISVAFFMYFIIGIIYRRLVHGAQGCQQLPHFSFWQRIGALCSDGCNYLCRCDEEPKFTWNNGTNNFDSGDRDDALLKP